MNGRVLASCNHHAIPVHTAGIGSVRPVVPIAPTANLQHLDATSVRSIKRCAIIRCATLANSESNSKKARKRESDFRGPNRAAGLAPTTETDFIELSVGVDIARARTSLSGLKPIVRKALKLNLTSRVSPVAGYACYNTWHVIDLQRNLCKSSPLRAKVAFLHARQTCKVPGFKAGVSLPQSGGGQALQEERPPSGPRNAHHTPRSAKKHR